MAGQKRLSIAEKELIKSWVNTGSSNKKIALRLNRGQSTIRRFTAALRLMNNPSSPSSPSPNFPTSPASPTSPLGRPPKVTEVAKRSLKKFIMSNPRASAAECKIADPGNLKDISIRTIQATLKDKLGIPSRRAAKKPLLTLRMKKMRLMFAKKYKHWTSSDWRNVMYSDESSFKTIRSSSVMVRRPLGADPYDPRFTVKTVKWPDSIMVWGCFSGNKGRGGLFFLPPKTTMNGEKYKAVLENHLLPSMQMHESTHFLQDGAPCHKSKLVMWFLKDANFHIIDWPGNSPDLNPIENV